VYTACRPLVRTIRKKPPLWQVKGARIIPPRPKREDAVFRNSTARILRRADGPYLPYFFDARIRPVKAQDRLPDAEPRAKSSVYGYGVEVPFYWGDRTGLRCGPSAPRHHVPPGRCCCRVNSASGWRTGPTRVRAYGIDQLDPGGAFTGQVGDPRSARRHRHQGPVRTERQMGSGGWEGVLLLGLHVHVRLPAWRNIADPFSSFLNLPTEAVFRSFI